MIVSVEQKWHPLSKLLEQVLFQEEREKTIYNELSLYLTRKNKKCWIIIIGAEKSHWWTYLHDKVSLSPPSDDQTQTLLRIYWAELEKKAGSGIRVALNIFSSGSLLRTLQETLLVPPRLLRRSGLESFLHPVDFSPEPFIILSLSENLNSFLCKSEDEWKDSSYLIYCLLLVDDRKNLFMCAYIEISMKELRPLWKIIETLGLEAWDKLEQEFTWFCLHHLDNMH